VNDIVEGVASRIVKIDDVARGIAMAALTPQSALLQALVAHGAMSPEQAREVVDLAMEASMRKQASKAEDDVALVTVEALQEVRKGLEDMVN
jgi:hypothetical protein